MPKVSLPKWQTLLTVAGGMGVGVGLMALLLRKKTDSLVRQASFINEAVTIFQSQEEVKKLIGDKIDVGAATFSDEFGKLERKHIQLRVPIKGESDNVFLYAYARKNEEKDRFRLYKLEATFGKIQNKKLILLDRTNEVDEEEISEKEAKIREKERLKNMTPEERKKHAIELMKSWQ